MTTVAEQVYKIVRELPASKAVKVLDFAEQLNSTKIQDEDDFFAMAGLWENRSIDLIKLRKQAWPERRG